MILRMEQKAGFPDRLDGRVTVYAHVDMGPSELVSLKNTVVSMIHNNFITTQGNYKDHSNLRDFIKAEMHTSLEDLLEKLEGSEPDINPESLSEKLDYFDEMSDYIPTPAKIMAFNSEPEILNQEGDIFFAGTFANPGNAIMSVNSFPIFYQARYREQEIENVRHEIDQLTLVIERSKLSDTKIPAPVINIEEIIFKEYIPNMIYNRKDPKVFFDSEKQFRSFMQDYQFKDDVDNIISIIAEHEILNPKYFNLLELYVKKISEVRKEHFEEAEKLRRAIEHESHLS